MCFPTARSILWTPANRNRADGEASPRQYPPVITQAVLRVIVEQLSGSLEEARFGFLLGDLYRCPDTGLRYALIDTVLPVPEPFVEKTAEVCLLRAWSRSQEDFLRRAGLLLGWYHSHPGRGLELSEADRTAIRKYFRETWQVALVLVPESGRPVGELFGSLNGGRVAHDVPVSFYELIEMDSGAADEAAAESIVDWRNYVRLEEPVLTGRVRGRVKTNARVRREASAGGSGGEGSGARRRASPRRSRRGREGRDEDSTPGSDPRDVQPGGASGGDRAASEPSEAGDLESPAEERSDSPVVTPERSERPATEAEAPASTSAPSAPSPAAGATPSAADPPRPPTRGPAPPVSIVMPVRPDDEEARPIRWKRLLARGPGRWVAALLVVAAVVVAVLVGRRPEAPPVEPEETPVPIELGPLAGLNADLEAAIDGYWERRADFEAGLIACDLLSRGYEAADDAFIAAARAFGQFGSAADPEHMAEFERLTSEMNRVNSHFDEAGCSRPR